MLNVKKQCFLFFGVVTAVTVGVTVVTVVTVKRISRYVTFRDAPESLWHEETSDPGRLRLENDFPATRIAAVVSDGRYTYALRARSVKVNGSRA